MAIRSGSFGSDHYNYVCTGFLDLIEIFSSVVRIIQDESASKKFCASYFEWFDLLGVYILHAKPCPRWIDRQGHLNQAVEV